MGPGRCPALRDVKKLDEYDENVEVVEVVEDVVEVVERADDERLLVNSFHEFIHRAETR